MKKSSLIITEQLLQIMKKPREERLAIDNDFLSLHLMQLSFFASILDTNEYGLIMYKTVIRCLEFKTYQPNDPIFKYKEPYNSMLIVIDGSVTIYKPPIGLSDKSILKKEKSNTADFFNTIKKLIAIQVLKEEDRVMTQGEAYGSNDIKILKKHPCLVEAKSKCIIGLLVLTDYSLIFEKTEFLNRVTINRLLCSFPFFTHLNQKMLNNLVLAVEKETFNKGEYVIMQGDPLNKIYFVSKGLFRISLKNTRRFFNDFDLSYFDKLNPERFSTNRKFELKDSYKEIVDYQLINFGPGEIIGDCEYKFNSDLSYFTIQCDINNSELLSLSMTHFNQYLFPQHIPLFEDKVNKKLSLLKNRLNEIRLCQQKLFFKNNKYFSAILRKLPRDKAQINRSTILSRSKLCHEKKFRKIVEVNNIEKKRMISFVNHKRIQYSSNLSIEYSEMNMNDYIATHFTYIPKNKEESAGTKELLQPKIKNTCTPKMINVQMIKDHNRTMNDILFAKYNEKSLNEENKKNKSMLNKNFFQSKNNNIQEFKKENMYFSGYRLTKRIILRNNSIKIKDNSNSLFQSMKESI